MSRWTQHEQLATLVQAMCDQTIDSQQVEQLEALLSDDPDACEFYVDLLGLEADLLWMIGSVAEGQAMREQLKLPTDSAESGVPSPAVSKHSRSGARQWFSRTRVAWGLGMAAAVCGVFVLWAISPGVQIGVIESASGEVSLSSGLMASQAAEGAKVYDGAEVICPAGNNEATVRLSDGSTFRLVSGTRASFAVIDEQARLTLSKGLLVGDVKKQPSGSPLRISTPSAEVTVLGTRLRLSQAEDSARLSVEEGRVEIRSVSNDAKSFVGVDESVVVGQSQALQVTSVAELKVDKLEIVRARYGAETTWIDVSPQLQSRTANSRRIPLGGRFHHMAGDPLVGVIKTLEVEYKINGKLGQAKFLEYIEPGVDWTPRTEITLPMP